MNCVWIGDDFCWNSKTMMSPVYKINGNKKNGLSYERTDWGFISIALDNGEIVNIRQATEKEMNMFKKKLEAIK